MDLGLEGTHAIITGGSRGIGRNVAEQFLQEGASVTLVARDAARAHRTAEELRDFGTVDVVVADLSTPEGIAAAAVHRDRVDVLVNNAGSIPGGGLADVDPAAWRSGWELKVLGTVDLTRALYPPLAAAGGVVVNVIGAAATLLPPDYLAGSSGNAALAAFTGALGKSARADGVRVVGVSPGPTATERLTDLLRSRAERDLGDSSRWRELIVDLPFQRLAKPEEIAAAVVFLASPRSAYTTGTVLTVDGAPTAPL